MGISNRAGRIAAMHPLRNRSRSHIYSTVTGEATMTLEVRRIATRHDEFGMGIVVSDEKLGAVGGDRLFAEPHHKIATRTQARFIGGPIRQPPPLLRDMVATLGVGFEQHGGIRDQQGTAPSTPSDPRTNAMQTPPVLTGLANRLLPTVAFLLCAQKSKPGRIQ